MKDTSILKKILFDPRFININSQDNSIKFTFEEKEYEISNKNLSPINKYLNNLFELKELKEVKKLIPKPKQIIKEDNFLDAKIGDNHPYIDIIKNGKPLSWTGSAGVDKFISCPRLAFLSSKRQRKIFGDNAVASMDIGTFIHEYILRKDFSIADAREALRYFINIHLPLYPQHTGIDIINTIYKGRVLMFEMFDKLGSGYTPRFEEMTMSTYHRLNFVQYVDAYAFKFVDGKLKVMIIDVKTSSRAEVKEMSYWGQLLYYRYNLRKRLANEFKISEDDIEFETHILWVFYKKIKKSTLLIKSIPVEEGQEVILSSPMIDMSVQKIIKNSKFILPLINITYNNKKTISFYKLMMNQKSDTTKIISSPIHLTDEHENYLKEDIKRASETIYKGNISANFHSCNKSVWGCDYESICHFKTKQAKGLFVDKDHMKKIIYENIDEKLIKKVIPTW